MSKDCDFDFFGVLRAIQRDAAAAIESGLRALHAMPIRDCGAGAYIFYAGDYSLGLQPLPVAAGLRVLHPEVTATDRDAGIITSDSTKWWALTADEPDPYATASGNDEQPLLSGEAALTHIASAVEELSCAVTGRSSDDDIDYESPKSLADVKRQMLPMLAEMQRLLERLG